MKRMCGLTAAGMLLFGTATLADTVSIQLSGMGVMTSPEGKVRLLLAAPDLPSTDDIAISEAYVRIPLPIAALDRSLRGIGNRFDPAFRRT